MRESPGPGHSRYGAFLACIPPLNRVGDYAHCGCRVVNAILKRLRAQPQVTLSLARDIRRFIAKVAWDTEQVPAAERVGEAGSRRDTLEMTATKFFIGSTSLQNELIALVERHTSGSTVPFHGRPFSIHGVLRILLRNLHHAWQFCGQRTPLTTEEAQEYCAIVARFGEAWRALGWKPTVWVHWLVCHSGCLMAHHRSLYLFSSIPSERRHQGFKRDLRHSFMGWKVKNPRASAVGFKHALELEALDHGLRELKKSRLAAP